MATSVLVDDVDPDILYSPEAWEAGPVSDFRPNSYFNNTFHHLKDGGKGGTVQYTFNGTSFMAGGAFVQKDNKGNFTYQCFVDGRSLATVNPSPQVGILCEASGLFDGQHTITIGVMKDPTSHSQFWIDYIVYTPSSPPSTESGSLFIPASSSRIAYDGKWMNISSSLSNGFSSNDATAVLSSNFSGQSVTWFSCPQPESSQNAFLSALASFTSTLDDLTTLSLVDTTPILFSASWNAPGKHQLKVSYSGGGDPLSICGLGFSQTPLNQYTLGIHSQMSTMIGSSEPSSHLAEPSKTKAIIAGSIIGGVVIGVLLVIGILLLKRYRNRKEMRRESRLQSTITGNIFSPRPSSYAFTRDSMFPASAINYTETETVLPPIPPLPRWSMSKPIISSRSFRMFKPSPQTAQVGSDYTGTPLHSPRGGYSRGITGNTLDTELEK